MVEVAKLGELDCQYDDKNLHWLNDSELTRYRTISTTERKRQQLAAMVSDTPVGIDIETFSRQRDFLVIARHVLSKTEIVELESCNAE